MIINNPLVLGQIFNPLPLPKKTDPKNREQSDSSPQILCPSKWDLEWSGHWKRGLAVNRVMLQKHNIGIKKCHLPFCKGTTRPKLNPLWGFTSNTISMRIYVVWQSYKFPALVRVRFLPRPTPPQKKDLPWSHWRYKKLSNLSITSMRQKAMAWKGFTTLLKTWGSTWSLLVDSIYAGLWEKAMCPHRYFLTHFTRVTRVFLQCFAHVLTVDWMPGKKKQNIWMNLWTVVSFPYMNYGHLKGPMSLTKKDSEHFFC